MSSYILNSNNGKVVRWGCFRFHPTCLFVNKSIPSPAVFIYFVWFVLALLPGVQQAETNECATVSRIVDGDTLKINYKGKTESIRLIGVDTPESNANKKAKKDSARTGRDVETITAMGKASANFMRSLVKPGDSVRIEFDIQVRDKYGRLLAYIYLPNGKMLNEEIVKAGYATIMTYPPNVKYQERFLTAHQEARESKRGLWK